MALSWLLSLLLLPSVVLGSLQSISVNGTLLCNDEFFSDAVVFLMDSDFGSFFDPDDTLAGPLNVNDKGYFELSGETSEFTTIEPYIKIEHTCDVENEKCRRTTIINIDKSFINNGRKDMGEIGLEAILANEKPAKCN